MRPLAALRVFAARRVGAGEWGRLLGPAPLPGSAAHGPRGGLLALSRALLLRSPFPRLSHPRGQPPAGSAELLKPPLRLMSGLGPGRDLHQRWGSEKAKGRPRRSETPARVTPPAAASHVSHGLARGGSPHGRRVGIPQIVNKRCQPCICSLSTIYIKWCIHQCKL